MDINISPTLMLGVVLFIILILVARAWLLQDERDRRDARDRRQQQLDDNPSFPFYDDEGQWVTRERRKRPDRRQIHTFISGQDFRQSK